MTDLREGLIAVVEDLKRRQNGGEREVVISEASIDELRGAVRKLRQQTAGAATPEAQCDDPGPETERSTVPQPPSKKTESTPPAWSPKPLPEPPTLAVPEGSKQERLDWLRERVLNCPTCREHVREGKQVVFGVGSVDASIFFCGEAPGADEEDQGEPFVGRAGQLLTKIIGAMGLDRGEVYIGNILNWRPEKEDMNRGNRKPTEEEMAFCLPYLEAQIEIVQPKIVVALGNTAVSGLLGPDPKRRLGKIRGQWLEWRGFPLMATYHPSYLLQYASAAKKREVWEDMMAVMEKVGLPITEKQRGYYLPKDR
jgi:DNA polymerase